MTEKNTVTNAHSHMNDKTERSLKREAGMVSAETALGALALAIVFILMLSVIGASALYLHAQDLSRSAARAVSLGHSYEEVSASVRKSDSRASVKFEGDGESVRVTVTLEPPSPVKKLGFDISATTVAPLEPGGAP